MARWDRPGPAARPPTASGDGLPPAAPAAAAGAAGGPEALRPGEDDPAGASRGDQGEDPAGEAEEDPSGEADGTPARDHDPDRATEAAGSGPEGREDLTVTVLVTLYEDPRFRRTVESLLEGDRVPEEVLVADGGSEDGSWEQARAMADEHDPVRAVRRPGSVARTRDEALDDVRGQVVAFVDADEVAPPHWLGTLVAPIEAGEADFVGGPTRPLGPPESRAEAYVNAFDAWFYDRIVPRNISALPMGNSAWRADLVREVGGFDPRLDGGGEDYDLNLRALAHGAEGRFVPEAWLYHDQSHLDSIPGLLRRKYRYSRGAVVAYLKNDVLGDKLEPSARSSTKFRHPLAFLLILVKPLALLAGWIRWRRLRREGEP